MVIKFSVPYTADFGFGQIKLALRISMVVSTFPYRLGPLGEHTRTVIVLHLSMT